MADPALAALRRPPRRGRPALGTSARPGGPLRSALELGAQLERAHDSSGNKGSEPLGPAVAASVSDEQLWAVGPRSTRPRPPRHPAGPAGGDAGGHLCDRASLASPTATGPGSKPPRCRWRWCCWWDLAQG